MTARRLPIKASDPYSPAMAWFRFPCIRHPDFKSLTFSSAAVGEYRTSWHLFCPPIPPPPLSHPLDFPWGPIWTGTAEQPLHREARWLELGLWFPWHPWGRNWEGYMLLLTRSWVMQNRIGQMVKIYKVGPRTIYSGCAKLWLQAHLYAYHKACLKLVLEAGAGRSKFELF